VGCRPMEAKSEYGVLEVRMCSSGLPRGGGKGWLKLQRPKRRTIQVSTSLVRLVRTKAWTLLELQDRGCLKVEKRQSKVAAPHRVRECFEV
jgi:hypothetical protein